MVSIRPCINCTHKYICAWYKTHVPILNKLYLRSATIKCQFFANLFQPGDRVMCRFNSWQPAGYTDPMYSNEVEWERCDTFIWGVVQWYNGDSNFMVKLDQEHKGRVLHFVKPLTQGKVSIMRQQQLLLEYKREFPTVIITYGNNNETIVFNNAQLVYSPRGIVIQAKPTFSL